VECSPRHSRVFAKPIIRMAARIAIAMILILAPGILAAKEYSFKLYTRQEGLLNQVINCLLQDRKGFLWAGTQNGLYRYDGARFSFFGRADGLPDETIQSLFETPDGTLWVGTRLGTATFDGKRRFFPDADIGATELFGYSNIVSLTDHRLFVGTARGLAVKEKATGSGKTHFHFLTTEAVHGVYVDPSGVLWFAAEGKLWFLQNGVPVWIGQESKIPIDRWDSMLLDKTGTLWARSSERLVFRRKGSPIFEIVPGIPPSAEFGSLYETRDGRVFVPTDDALMEYAGGRWERISSRNGLISDEATCALQDRDGSVWIGLGGEGLERWLGFNEWESWTAADGLASNIVWDLERDASGKLWTATESGLNVQDPVTGDWKLKGGKGVSVVTALEDAPHKAIWFGANPGGLSRLDTSTGEIRRFGSSAGLTSDRISKLFWGRDRELWATTRAGLFRGKLVGNGVQFKQEDVPYTDPNEAFFGYLLDRDGRIWVGGSRGLVVLENGNWRRFSKPDGLAGDGVSQLAQTPDGAIWIGYLSNSGISRLVFKSNKVHFDHFTTNNGLTSNGTVFVNADLRGWLWVGSDNGVDVYADSVWKHYGKVDGLVADDCDSLAFLADPDGSVWIGTSGGISHFRPPANLRAKGVPPIYVTSITAGMHSIDPAIAATVPYQDRSLLFRFAAPTFLTEAATRFRYRMVGLDSDWADAEERWVRYPNLTAGSYQFQVVAQNAGGEWSRPATAAFRILAPWWQTWKLRVFVAVLLAAGIYRVWMFRIRYLLRKQELLESLLGQARTADRLKTEALEKVTKGESREKNRSYVLELIGSHKALEQVLDSIVAMVELDDPETFCLILTIRDGRFHQGASRKFPEQFASLFDGMPIESAATCFAAAARGSQPMHVNDLAKSPLWAGHADRLSGLGIACSRSAPILSSVAEVLGTITCFRKTPFSDQSDGSMFENAGRLASVAIEHLSLYEQLSYRAQHDILTGLPNRMLFHDRLRQSIVRAEQAGTKLWVLWLDLDGFKYVNDTLGHKAGDALLKEVAARISRCLRQEDTVARIGGDEFTVILESGEEFDVEAVIRKLIAVIGRPVTFEDQEAFVTASVGVSIYPDDSREASELIRNADIAMYHVKRQGKNAHNFFVPEMATRESKRIEIESHLRNALANQEFELYYQPQVRLDGGLTGFEALLRWTNPKIGTVSPSRFIPIAEATGLIIPIGQWVLEEACRQLAEWTAAGFQGFRMAVNVSTFQFARADFAASVAHLLAVMRIEPRRFELELTETAIMKDIARSSAQLRKLRESGVTIAIDDFGTGYSSLSYLQRLPVDAIKIDQSFVRSLGISPSSSLPMVQAIANLAHDLNLLVVAEGVETEEQLGYLRTVGCDLAQGYLFDEPLTKHKATMLLATSRNQMATGPEETRAENLVGAQP